MKTEELAGARLDYWVAKAEGFEVSQDTLPLASPVHRVFVMYKERWLQFQPSTTWAQGGLIIEREKIETHPRTDRGFAEWGALPWTESVQAWEKMKRGETPLIAAMRVYVASKFGDEVAG